MMQTKELFREGTTIIVEPHSPCDAEKACRIVRLFGWCVVTENI